MDSFSSSLGLLRKRNFRLFRLFYAESSFVWLARSRGTETVTVAERELDCSSINRRIRRHEEEVKLENDRDLRNDQGK